MTHDDAEFQAWKAAQGPQGPAPTSAGPTTHDDAEYQAWKASQPKPPSTLYNVLNTFDNALTFGLGQKFDAAVSAVGDKLHGRDSFTNSYTKHLGADQQSLADFRAQHPYVAATAAAPGAALQVIAGNKLGLLPEAETARGMSMGARTAAAARAGAGVGAVNAVGNAPNSGGALDNVLTATKGAAIGGGIGALAAPATQGVASLAGKASPMLQRAAQRLMPSAATDGAVVDGSAPGSTALATVPRGTMASAPPAAAAPAEPPTIDRATQLILKRLQRTGLTPQEAMDRLALIPPDKPVSVMEIAGEQSHPLQQLGKWVARTPSRGASELRSAVAERASPLPNAQRVLGDVSEAFGADRTNMLDHTDALKAQQVAKAKPFYDAAFSEQTPPVLLSAQVGDDGPTLGDLMKRPSLKGAVKSYNVNASERGESPLVLGQAEANSEGEQTYRTMVAQGIPSDKARAFVDQQYPRPAEDAVSLKTLQHLKFELDDALMFAKAHDRLPDGSAATKVKLGAINDTRKSLLDIMKAHSSDYAQGNSIWAGDAAVQEAGDAGRGFLSRPFDELQRSYPAMTPGEQQQHNVAAVSGPIRDRIFNTSAVDRAKIFANPDMQERLQATVPQNRLDVLRQKLATEHQIAVTNQQIPGGSDTAENLANDVDASGRLAKSVASGVAMARPRRIMTAAVKSVVNPLVDQWVRGINETTANALAPKLTAGMTSRADVESFLNDLATALDRMQRTRGSLPFAGAVAGQFPSARPSP